MDGITYEQFQSVFGDLGKEFKDSNTTSIEKLQAFVGNKIDGIEASIKKLESISDYLKNLKGDKSETNKVKEPEKKKEDRKTESILDILPTSASKVISASAKLLPVRVVDDPKKHTPVDLYIPAETRVWIENLLYDTLDHLIDEIKNTKKETKKEEKPKDEKKSWVDKLLAGLMGAGLIGRLLGGIMKPFTWLAGNLLKLLPRVIKDVGKLLFPMVRGLLGSVGPLLAGAGLAIGGIMTLLSGIKDSGPYKGIKKILGKGLLASGTALLKNEFGKLGKLALDASKSLAKGGFVRNFVAGVTKGFRNIFRTISALPGKVFGGITKAFKSMFSGVAGKATGALAKGGGKSLISRLAGTAGTFLLKGLKRLPLIGTLIGLGFAISRIMKGDFIGGALDIASAIATSVPVVGTALSIAIDLFSAYRDTQTGGSEKAGAANKDWMSNAWKWVKDSLKKVPLIRHLIDMGTHISEGKWGEAFLDIAEIIPGVEFIVNLFKDEKAAISELAASGKPITLTGILKATGSALIKAVLNMLPESIFGVSIRARVAKMLGVEGFGDVNDKNEAASVNSKNEAAPVKDKQEKVPAPAAKVAALPVKKPSAQASPQQNSNANTNQAGAIVVPNSSLKISSSFGAVQPAKEQSTPPINNVQPIDDTQDTIKKAQQSGAMADPDFAAKVLQLQLDELKKSIEINTRQMELQYEAGKKQDELIKAFREFKNNTGNSVSVANISNPTTFVSSSMTSPAFRQGVLQR
jgi:hypothetical protein